jgi:squalene synthase HpnC
MEPRLREAYAHCAAVARGHAENFPTASLLLPSAVRPHVAAVYAFARGADDTADEGNLPAEERLRRLSEARAQLRACAAAGADVPVIEDPVYRALGHTIARFSIPEPLFHDLLDAFTQDVTVTGYRTFDDLLAYCRRSANPVGRIVLALYGLLDDSRTTSSDAICTGLQLANFWQDVSVDRRKPRVYLPEEDLARFGLTRRDILEGTDSDATRALLRFEVERARACLAAGATLPLLVHGRLRWWLRAVIRGGVRILDKIERMEFGTVTSRPRLGTWDMLRIAAATIPIGGETHAIRP